MAWWLCLIEPDHLISISEAFRPVHIVGRRLKKSFKILPTTGETVIHPSYPSLRVTKNTCNLFPSTRLSVKNKVT